MKKTYIAPKATVTELELQRCILAISIQNEDVKSVEVGGTEYDSGQGEIL